MENDIILLVLLNPALKSWLSLFAFSQGELVTIYMMLFLAVGIAGHAFWSATPENEWQRPKIALISMS